MKFKKSAQELINYINSATSPYQVVEEGINKLREAGFIELDFSKPWQLKPGVGYYVMPYATSLFAFSVGDDFESGSSIRIAAAHTDHPGIRIKPRAEMISNSYCKLNVEVYGGPILNTWMDRPLSIAGRVALRSKDPFNPTLKTLDIKKPILTIPNLAIHINKDVNKGVELNKQTDIIPLFSMVKDDIEEEKFFLKYLAKELNVEVTEILDYDMYIYNQEEGGIIGANEDFISCPRLDNLTSVWALLKAVIGGKRKAGINLIALYDNEEIGSRTKQGADSMLLNILLEKIYDGLNVKRKESLYEAIADSLLISVDVAHGIHPNRPEKYDPTNNTKLNDGVVFKIDSNQKYTFDTQAVAIMQQICEVGEIKYQKFVNRSDMPGGGTLGPIISSWLPMKTVDLGAPILAMHSSRELMGTKDQAYLEKLVLDFFSL